MLQSIRSLTLAYCPSNWFEDEFQFSEDENWYNWYRLKYFLFEYEEHLAKKKEIRIAWHDIEALAKEKSIEHILPQTPKRKYWTQRFKKHDREKMVHDIGNLVLTYRDANSAYGNKPFPEKKGHPGAKKPCYANADFYQEQELFNFKDWTKENLFKRREKIVEWALNRWKIEEALPAEVEPEKDEEVISNGV